MSDRTAAQEHARSRRNRTGFTLIELLVVIAIIAVLIALLLPAVQQAREAARRTQCRNHMMQLALALHNYEMAHLVLPSGSVNASGPIENKAEGYHMGWIVQTLPYFEQQNVYNHFDFSAGVYDEVNLSPRMQHLSLIVCPSSYEKVTDLGQTNYGGCHHHEKSPIGTENSGLLYLNSSIAYEDINDGSSNTILLGEFMIDDFELGWASGTRTSLRNAGTPINAYSTSGQRWRNQPVEENPELADPLYVGGFGSAHEGGMHAAFADGSVRFISENLKSETLSSLANRGDGEMLGEF